jgi:hypothetical protein
MPLVLGHAHRQMPSGHRLLANKLKIISKKGAALPFFLRLNFINIL